MPMTRQAVMDDLAGRHVQRSKECGGPVTLVVVRHRSRPTLLERKAGLGSVQCLDLTLLVEGEHDRPLRRRYVQSHHVAQLLDELRVRGQLEVADPVRSDPVRSPDARHQRCLQPRLLRHEPGAPMRSSGRRRRQRPAH